MNREVLRLSLPSMLSNITVPFVGMVDIAVAGHLYSSGLYTAAAHIGGISIGSMIFELLYWSFAFLRTSTGGLVAQSYGKGDMRECGALFMRSLLLALLSVFLILILQWPFRKGALILSACSPEVASLATRYVMVRIWAAPATLSLMAFRGFFVGMQDSFSSMCTDLVVNVVNIISSILLTIGVPALGFGGLGFDGMALGT